jgi:hypothetical protein
MKVPSWKSRKLGFSFFCVMVLAGVAMAAAHFPAIAGVYTVFVGGVTGIAGLYLGANVAELHVDGKNAAATKVDP